MGRHFTVARAIVSMPAGRLPVFRSVPSLARASRALDASPNRFSAFRRRRRASPVVVPNFFPVNRDFFRRFWIFWRCTARLSCVLRFFFVIPCAWFITPAFFRVVQTAYLIILDFFSLFRTLMRVFPIFFRYTVRLFDLFQFFFVAAVHSDRSATVGSTFVARSAGTNDARSDAASNSSGAVTRTTGSTAFTPYKTFSRICPAQRPAAGRRRCRRS